MMKIGKIMMKMKNHDEYDENLTIMMNMMKIGFGRKIVMNMMKLEVSPMTTN